MLLTYVSLLWPILLLYVLKKFLCQLPEDGEIIVPKHVVAMEKIVCINYRTVLLLLQNLSNVF